MIKQKLPWWLIIACKLILVRTPLPYNFWRQLRLFRHGNMDNPEHALSVFNKVLQQAKSHGVIPEKFTMLEIGPGDSLLSAVIAKSYGAKQSYLIDAGAFSINNVSPYKQLAKKLKAEGLPAPDLDHCLKLEEILEACSAIYYTQGLQSLKKIPDSSIDLHWSNVVLEHIPFNEFLPMMQQLKRVSNSTATGIHAVDLRDHIGGALNNLRIEKKFWESEWMSRSGFYTNRIRYSQMLEYFKQAGFKYQVLSQDTWPQLPTPRNVMIEPYRSLSDQDLLIAEFDVVLL